MSDPCDHRFRDGAWIGDAIRQHPTAASIAATAIVLAGALLLAGGLAWARGGGLWPPAAETGPHDGAAPAVDVPSAPKQRETRANGLAVCVRLCDGFFFPSAASSAGDDACAIQCPDAPTARYTERAGSDSIDDAVSTHGALYSALPVAHRFQTTLDSTCRCHRSPINGYSASVLNDPTLRKGDVVMTPNGFLVFQGAKARPVAPSDFVALSQASSLPKNLRSSLVAMERAGASLRQAGVGSSLGGTAKGAQVWIAPTSAIPAR
jgi:hypothetical protein